MNLLILLVIIIIVVIVIILVLRLGKKESHSRKEKVVPSAERSSEQEERSDTIISSKEPQGTTSYLEYDNKRYKLDKGYVYKSNSEQYSRNKNYKYYISDPNLTLVVISKKHGYVCDGDSGIRNVEVYHYSEKSHTVGLSKNSSCFPQGGLEPEYFLVIPANKNLNSYLCGEDYVPSDDSQEIYEFFVEKACKA
jgi:hypothetical protein